MTQAQILLSSRRRGRRLASDEPRPALTRFFSVLTEPQTALNLVYLLLAFPLGIA